MMELTGFTHVELLYRDSLSTTYKGRCADSFQTRRITRLSRQLLENNACAPLLQEEISYLEQLQIPQIARFYPPVRHDDDLLIVSEFIEGEALNLRRAKLCLLDRIFAIKEILRLTDQLASHDFGHYNLKPENIIFMAKHGRVALTDHWLNYACQISRRDPFKDMGSLHYASPELLEGKELDIRADIYSIGALLFDLLSGNPLFKADKPSRLRHMQLTLDAPRLPNRFRLFQDIVDTALNKNPRDRFACGQQMIDALDTIDDVTLVELDNPTPPKVVVKVLKPKKTSLRQVATTGVKVKKLTTKPRMRMVVNNPAAELSPSLLVDDVVEQPAEISETLLDIHGDTEVTTPQEEPKLDESRLFEAINQTRTELEPEVHPASAEKTATRLSGTFYLALALLLVVLAAWWALPYLTDSTFTPVQEEPVAAMAPAEPQITPEQQVALWLGQADDYMEQLRFTTPVDASAYPLYQQVLELDPGNQQALSGINRIVEFYRQQSLQKIADKDLLEARALAVRGLNVAPGNEALLKIISDIDEAMNLE